MTTLGTRRDIVAHPPENRRGMGGGLNAGDVQPRQRLGVPQNGLQLRLENRHLVVTQFKAREIGDIADIDVAVGHGRNVGKQAPVSKCQVAGNRDCKNNFRIL